MKLAKVWPAWILFLGCLLTAPKGMALEGGPAPSSGSLFEHQEEESRGRGAEVLGLLLLVGLLGAAAVQWHRKRGAGREAGIRVLAMKPLGQREKVAVLEVLGRRMVLGITSHRITLLSEGEAGFADLMRGKEEPG